MSTPHHEHPDTLLVYNPQFREYGLVVHDGGTSSISIAYCPWGGKSLPESLRERWFEERGTIGNDAPFEQGIPDKYNTDEWFIVQDFTKENQE